MKSENVDMIVLSPRPKLSGSPAGDTLENVNTTPLANGAICYVQTGSTQGVWQLEKSATTAANGTSVIAPTAGGGRWFKKMGPGASSAAQWGARYDLSGVAPGAAVKVTLPGAPGDSRITLSGGNTLIIPRGFWLYTMGSSFDKNGNEYNLSLQSTSGGANLAGYQTTATSADQEYIRMTAFSNVAADGEQVFLAVTSAPAPPTIANGTFYLIRLGDPIPV